MISRGPTTLAGMRGTNSPTELAQSGGESLRLVRHGHGARALRLGLGPDLRPAQALEQLQHLLENNAFWANGRSLADLRQMLKHSAICVSAWKGSRLVGFGRATSDTIYRGTIWDLVVDAQVVGRGIGRSILAALLESHALSRCERIYLMTTNSAEFYKKMGFETNPSQILMIKEKSG
jgi:ribosomal protein S18 acetylase RimI-like enzyme